MAYLLDKTSFGTAHEMDGGGRRDRMRTLADKEPAFIRDYYERLGRNTGNALSHMQASNAVSQLHLYDEASVETTVSSYVAAAFTLLLSDERKTMGPALKVGQKHSTVLSAAWSYFADELNKDEGAGAIGVCGRCGRFFEQKRSTRVFCSDSCRVAAMREPGASGALGRRR